MAPWITDGGGLATLLIVGAVVLVVVAVLYRRAPDRPQKEPELRRPAQKKDKVKPKR